MAKSIKPLNDTQIKSLKPQAKEYLKADGYNLYLMVTPTNSKIWRFIYSHPTTKKRIKKTLGHYPFLSLLKAREQAREFNSLLAEKLDPFEYAEQQAKKEELLSLTVREMADIWKTKKQMEVLPDTFKDLWARLERWLFPQFGKVRLSDIDIRSIIQYFENVYLDHPDTVRKVVRYFINILDRAVLLGYLKYNPIAPLKGEFRKPFNKNQPAIHYSELPVFMRLLTKSSLLPMTKLLIEWQLLTMVRPIEAVMAEWHEIDLENALWNIPAYKMKGERDKKKPHSVPLSFQALELLKEIKKLNSGRSSFLFPHRTDSKQYCSRSTANCGIKRIDNGTYKGKFTSHGIRATARTYLTDIGIDHFVAEACLAHVAGDKVSRTYNRSDYLALRRDAMQKWGDYVEQCKHN
ncbi:tyrosine-type recombinase/integrase [Pasteurella multocida subsp. multocida]|uniref:Tyrosine-type recombinase/integrase n=1 Tax=Pasteurella multocida TaxID=747 RepID=A0A9X3URE3_PASMD|nr:tyrosine-type recombinase/integrase [Pasteurella multocida]MBF6980140.1 tyrosine-type recombinase/integrase [Pasteurella multocida]MDA5610589.1 tyrosine-type recombinase/integrase [Pasteurella multocida]MDA5613307.1 tyrosine-type recombinase/integrase [Pasteurella multocida]MDA5617768.1 tyrosine-type recombinase/integrase [Pasteurella multocida subsp. multocida]MDA5621293.1 tyrosine-type recombinase/integrase [Pasteurella multocida subsp. multocida]